MKTAFGQSQKASRVAYGQVVSILGKGFRCQVDQSTFNVGIADPLTLISNTIQVGDWLMIIWQGETPFAVSRLDRRSTWGNQTSDLRSSIAAAVASGGTTVHDIIGSLHTVSSEQGKLVGVYPNNTLALLTLLRWLEISGGMYLGRLEGNHVGLIIREGDEGTEHVFEITHSGGEQIANGGYTKDVPNSFWWKLGIEGGPQITYTNNGNRNGIEEPGVWHFPAEIIEGYLGIETGTALPEAYDYDPGYPFALISPGDPYSFILYMRDNLDGWQRLIGAGYAAVHSHTSDETGGLIVTGLGAGLDDPAYVQDETTYAVLYDETTGEPITTGLFVEPDSDVAFTTLQVGDVSGGDYAEFEADGSFRLYGDATAFEDLRIDGLQTRTGVVAPTDETGFRGDVNFYARNFVHSQADEVQFSVQMPHGWNEGSPIFPHVHFAPWISNTGDKAAQFILEYYWANVDGTFPASPSNYTMTKTWNGDKQWAHMIALNASGLSTSGKTLSSILKCRLYRDNTVTDNLQGKVTFLYFDIHYEADSLGSRQEYIK
jgi:hypothetical protein